MTAPKIFRGCFFMLQKRTYVWNKTYLRLKQNALAFWLKCTCVLTETQRRFLQDLI